MVLYQQVRFREGKHSELKSSRRVIYRLVVILDMPVTIHSGTVKRGEYHRPSLKIEVHYETNIPEY